MMIEASLLSYLEEQNIANVYMETPRDREAEYILIEKTGSSERNGLSSATIAIQSISETSLYRAAVINDQVKRAMKGFIYSTQGINVFRSALNTDYNFTNSATKQYRYQAVFDLVYREE